ncbi:MAG: TonB-dependent receptor [Nitrospira sp.]|nr:TonB-dependent receptor [Nitrospira sp.]
MAVVVCLIVVPLQAWAEPSFSIPRASSTTERQLQEESLYLKEEIVSIASRYEQPISKAPSDVYVITDEDIRNSGATDIPTLLRQVPGMEVMQMNAADFNVSVRGNNQLHANKLLVLVDGRSIYLDQSGTVFWKLLPVALTEVKRIEVLKCTAPDFLDTSIAILDPTCGSPRSTIIVPEPMLCALFSRPPSDLPDGLSPPCAHAAADGLRKSRRT